MPISESALDEARVDYEKRREEARKLWGAFSEEKKRVEAGGAKASDVTALETASVRP